jgi:phage virion morphogenesis protein
MALFKIEVDDAAVQAALGRLAAAVKNPRPALAAIGEALLAQTRHTFETSTDPWGRRWALNAPATFAALLRRGGGNFRRDGRLSAQGVARVMAKRPLIGESRFLSGASIHYRAGAAELSLGSSAEYAAIHQLGGRAGRGRKVTIPPRPFLPIDAAATLAPQAERAILDIITEHVSGAAE